MVVWEQYLIGQRNGKITDENGTEFTFIDCFCGRLVIFFGKDTMTANQISVAYKDILSVNVADDAPNESEYEFYMVEGVDRRGVVTGSPLVKMCKLGSHGIVSERGSYWSVATVLPGRADPGQRTKKLRGVEFTRVTSGLELIEKKKIQT